MSIDDFKSQEEYVSQMEHGALLNPRIDSTFKALFTQPTQESHDALHSFLEAATEQKIKTFEITSNEPPISYKGQRQVNFDIACILDDGRIAEIEMQSFNQKYDYGKRAEYQIARLETTYLDKGDDWENAPIVFQITLLNFNYSPKGKNAINRYAMRTKDGLELSNSLNVIFIELPKIKNLENSVETNSQLENWALFFREADNPEKQNLIKKLSEKEAGLMQAKKSLSNISADKALWIAQWKQETFDRDIRSGLHAARAEGRMEGLVEGRMKGMNEKALETARNLLSMNILSAEQIAEANGLPLDDVKKLAKEMGL
ncbi:MAG: Rpn family recombination-promoting nuclease/putative transposase [Treponema sp.]|nr:Rpn family recombination-promoting nuclease/putative transposase [Treponema sp.]